MTRAAKLFSLAAIWFAVLTMPLLAHAGGLGIIISGALLGLGGLAIALSEPKFQLSKIPLWAWVFLAFLIWANASALWSPYKPEGLSNAHKIGMTGVALLFIPWTIAALREDQSEILRHVIVASSLMAAGLMLIDVLSGWGLSILVDPVSDGQNMGARQSDALMNVGHGIFTYGQYAPPLIILMFGLFGKIRGWLAGLALIGMLAIAGLQNQLAIAPIMLAISLAVMGLAYLWPKLIVRVSTLTFAGLIAAAPLFGIISSRMTQMPNVTLPGSWDHRIHMWAYVWEQIKAAPILGHGFDASRTFQETYPSVVGYDLALVSLHPHNIGLQVWMETGVIGAGLLIASILGLSQAAQQYAKTRHRAAALCGWLAGTAIIGATTLGLWQFWWWGVIGFGLVLLQFIPRDSALTLDENLRHPTEM